jgi:hypothetical protein
MVYIMLVVSTVLKHISNQQPEESSPARSKTQQKK